MQLNNAPVQQDKPLGCEYTGEVVTEESVEIRPPLFGAFAIMARLHFTTRTKEGEHVKEYIFA